MKLFIISAIVFATSISNLAAQTQVDNDGKISLEEKTPIAHSSDELNAQLSREFGEDYSLSNQQVISQLKKNIVDPNLTLDVRKTSLLLFYGDEYQNHIDLIQNEK